MRGRVTLHVGALTLPTRRLNCVRYVCGLLVGNSARTAQTGPNGTPAGTRRIVPVGEGAAAERVETTCGHGGHWCGLSLFSWLGSAWLVAWHRRAGNRREPPACRRYRRSSPARRAGRCSAPMGAPTGAAGRTWKGKASAPWWPPMIPTPSAADTPVAAGPHRAADRSHDASTYH